MKAFTIFITVPTSVIALNVSFFLSSSYQNLSLPHTFHEFCEFIFCFFCQLGMHTWDLLRYSASTCVSPRFSGIACKLSIKQIGVVRKKIYAYHRNTSKVLFSQKHRWCNIPILMGKREYLLSEQWLLGRLWFSGTGLNGFKMSK